MFGVILANYHKGDSACTACVDSAAADCDVDSTHAAAIAELKGKAPTLPKQRAVLLVELGNMATAKAALDAEKLTLANSAATAAAGGRACACFRPAVTSSTSEPSEPSTRAPWATETGRIVYVQYQIPPEKMAFFILW